MAAFQSKVALMDLASTLRSASHLKGDRKARELLVQKWTWIAPRSKALTAAVEGHARQIRAFSTGIGVARTEEPPKDRYLHARGVCWMQACMLRCTSSLPDHIQGANGHEDPGALLGTRAARFCEIAATRQWPGTT